MGSSYSERTLRSLRDIDHNEYFLMYVISGREQLYRGLINEDEFLMYYNIYRAKRGAMSDAD